MSQVQGKRQTEKKHLPQRVKVLNVLKYRRGQKTRFGNSQKKLVRQKYEGCLTLQAVRHVQTETIVKHDFSAITLTVLKKERDWRVGDRAPRDCWHALTVAPASHGGTWQNSVTCAQPVYTAIPLRGIYP